jgi:DNA/RNA endonuclease G (NUC1)
MKSTIRAARTAALAIALVACTADRLTGPVASGNGAVRLSIGPAGPVVRISEFHYDNDGGDANERIEISGPAGVDLTGWSVVRYNGSTASAATVYTSPGNPSLNGLVIPDQCTGRGTVVLSYPQDGLQNGTSDGFALVNSRGRVIELLSYEGQLTAAAGAAAGMTSTAIPNTASETPSSSNVGWQATGSVSRSPTGAWSVSKTSNTFGACNDDDDNTVADPEPTLVSMTISPVGAKIVVGTTQNFTATGIADDNLPIGTAGATWSTPDEDILEVNPTTGAAKGLVIGDTKIVVTKGNVTAETEVHIIAAPPPPPPLPSTRVSEFHYDNNGTPDVNEAIEIEGNAGIDLSGWSLVLYTGDGGKVYDTINLSGTIAATCNGRGAISFPAPGLQNGGFTTEEPDGFALVNGNTVVQFLSYEGSFTATDGPAAGMTSTDVGVEESGSTTSTQSIQLNTAGTWENRPANFGLVNSCATNIGVASISINHNGPDTLVVGWQRRAFVTYKDANGTTVSPTPTITWTSDTPGIATVDALGYATGVGAGTAIIRATIGSTSGTYSFKVINYEPVVAQYRNHAEFGVPAGTDVNNNVMLSKPGYITSYNPSRGGPNWVSWNINASTFGDAERCECFSPDTTLGAKPAPDIAAASWIDDQDYIGTGGYDRGHMVQSESRTSTHSENAATFLMTNILPQASNNNQGAWLGFENFLNDRARLDGKQVYVVAGGEYSAHPGTLPNSNGHVAIPDYTWKVAIVVNSGLGLSDVHGTADITMYAVRIPNLAGSTAPATKSLVFTPYVVTVDEIEAHTGYDFFGALPDNIENVLEANDHAPTAAFTAPATAFEGATVNFDATGSSDPDAGDVLTYEWSFSNGAASESPTPSVVFADNGVYTANLTVTDRYGATSTLTKNITVSNVPPMVSAFAGATILRGETYSSSGTFSDPGADTHTAAVDYGDGAGAASLALGAGAFSLSHAYAASGTFTVTVTVTDDDGGATSRTATVTVLSAASAIGVLSANVNALATAGTLTNAEAHELTVLLDAALKSLEKGNSTPAGNQLGAFINKVEALRSSGRISAATAQALIDYANRAIASIG